MTQTVEAALSRYAQKTEEYLKQVMPNKNCGQRAVIEAMEYSLFAGGKRIRPALAMLFCRACGKEEEQALPFAAAVEMIHSYSLIHDDLPCMDDDDMRRGRPSCHMRFGESTALLAGDGLLNLAYESVLAQSQDLPCATVVQALGVLGRRAGVQGMIGGQVLDLSFEGRQVDEKVLDQMHALKTGALIQAACEMGCIAAGATQEQVLSAGRYGALIGRVFQIVDDILDVNGDEQLLGKKTGSDLQSQKTTYVTLFGVEKAQQIAGVLTAEAKKTLDVFHLHDTILAELADFLLARRA